MMYYYWKTKGIVPSVFYNMRKGELLVLMAFYDREMEELKANFDDMPAF
ncbi:hypothetical protein HNQ80_003618 [Anaerosolibacter carboniphilus]|uniref:Uncharacterized protein n=1 Tax=Anaerosolibacter carboniphilus TaxID=1417629 RepID=A0A841KVV4_9FIRM|nr:hypothetical protein [Anaerosolibacter carboniphilus]MBB6217497.1 hypothetical protein [Anaerosolibacter carboniphilus]